MRRIFSFLAILWALNGSYVYAQSTNVRVNAWAGGTLGSITNYGTSPGAVLVPGMNAFVTGSSLGLTPGATTAGATGSFVGCGSTTNPSGQSTGNFAFLNCNPNGPIRVEESYYAGIALGAPSNFGTSPGAVASTNTNASIFYGTTAAVGDACQTQTPTIKPIIITIATTTNIVTGTPAKKIYVCYLMLTSAAADNVAVISGTTGATCGANTAALIGGTTAANGLNFSANGGVALGNGSSSVLQVLTNNDDICIITSASTPLAGVIKYVVQ